MAAAMFCVCTIFCTAGSAEVWGGALDGPLSVLRAAALAAALALLGALGLDMRALGKSGWRDCQQKF